MPADDHTEVLAVVRASAGRRILGVAALATLGLILIYIAFVQPPAFGWQLFLIGVGAVALWMADAMRRATASSVELTRQHLRDADGTVIALVDEITSMDRGFFAFKPSNGFLLRLNTSGKRGWRPGLWWRIGRRIGIGGMTPGNQTKYMVEVISALIAQHKS